MVPIAGPRSVTLTKAPHAPHDPVEAAHRRRRAPGGAALLTPETARQDRAERLAAWLSTCRGPTHHSPTFNRRYGLKFICKEVAEPATT